MVLIDGKGLGMSPGRCAAFEDNTGATFIYVWNMILEDDLIQESVALEMDKDGRTKIRAGTWEVPLD